VPTATRGGTIPGAAQRATVAPKTAGLTIFFKVMDLPPRARFGTGAASGHAEMRLSAVLFQDLFHVR
jgi:hypothetical protein